jgi:hypothetical protein
MGYATYKRACHTSKDCEPPLVCTYDERVQGRRCLSSECASNLECDEGFVCRAVRIAPVVRLCKSVGIRMEGERCEPEAEERKYSCGPGLLCLRGFCGRSCRPDDPTSCPHGTICANAAADGHACLPRCSPGRCPEGQECVRFDEELIVCGKVVTENCQRVPCPDGQVCHPDLVGLKDRIAMRCLSTCAPDRPCPKGEYCLGTECLRHCTQNADCGPLEECSLFPDKHVSLCMLQGS